MQEQLAIGAGPVRLHARVSFAYLELSTTTGDLLLFDAVQSNMIGYDLYPSERLRVPQIGGLLLAIGGPFGWLCRVSMLRHH